MAQRKSNTGFPGVSFMASRAGDSHAARFFVYVRGRKASFSCEKWGTVQAAQMALVTASLFARKWGVVGGRYLGAHTYDGKPLTLKTEAEKLAARVFALV